MLWLGLGSLGLATPALAQTQVTDPAPFLTTNLLTGSRSQRLNILAFGDGFRSNQTDQFQTYVTNIVINYLLTTEPFDKYKSYFNVYSIFAASIEEGADHLTPSVVTKDT